MHRGLLNQQASGGGGAPVAITAGSFASGTATAAPSIPSGSNDELLLLIAYNQHDSGSWAAITGWTNIWDEDSTQGNDRSLGIWWRLRDGTEGSTVTVTRTSGGSEVVEAFVAKFTGNDTTTPILEIDGITEAEAVTAGNTTTPASNSGGMGGASGDMALHVLVSQTSMGTTLTKPSGTTDLNNSTTITSEEFASAYETLSGTVGAAAWSTSGTASTRYLSATVIVAQA